jgi:hypothetical protein
MNMRKINGPIPQPCMEHFTGGGGGGVGGGRLSGPDDKLLVNVSMAAVTFVPANVTPSVLKLIAGMA